MNDMDLKTAVHRLQNGARGIRRPCWDAEDTVRLSGGTHLVRGHEGRCPDSGLKRFFRFDWTVDDLEACDYELVDRRVCFVSGHMDLTTDEFTKRYAPTLERALAAGDSFVVGDAPGADSMTQTWLAGHRVREVSVFHMLVAPRQCHATWFKLVGGFTSDRERDAAMTEASDYDVAWVRPGREKKSGTAQNLKRRAAKKAQKEKTDDRG